MSDEQASDFGFDFSDLDITGKKAWLDLPMLRGGEARIEVLPATDVNAKYSEAVLILNGKRKNPGTQSAEQKRKAMKRDRMDDRRLFAKYVVVGWENVLNREGVPVPFSKGACEELILGVPDWVFDRMRVFCMRNENFLDDDEDLGDEATLAKN